jgi:hypothetical protein
MLVLTHSLSVLLLCRPPQGLRVGVSSRGWASLVRHPVTQQLVVDDDFQLITFDFVPDPSNSGAFLYPMPRRYRWALPGQQEQQCVGWEGGLPCGGDANANKLQDAH